MSAHKIIFTGPVGAGKTTAIGAISDIEPFTTEEIATDETQLRKENTTVALDYGMLKLDGGERIHLYGTPGQNRFDFMWDILTENGIGLVLLIDNKRQDPFSDLDFFLSAFKQYITNTGVVVGVTRMSSKKRPTINDYHRWMHENEVDVPVFEIDARMRKDVNLLVQTLLYCLDPTLA